MQNSENNQQKYQNMVQRNYLSLNHDQNITDLQFLCQFSTSVIQLSVFNCDNITFTVAPQFITELIINHQQPIDFTGIKLMKLKKLICINTFKQNRTGKYGVANLDGKNSNDECIFKTLEHLQIQGYSSIQISCFKKSKHIQLCENLISLEIQNKIFTSYLPITHLDLKCGDLCNLDCINLCTDLICLDLSCNKITSVSVSDLSNLNKLQRLYLNTNLIQRFDFCNVNVYFVELSGNQLSSSRNLSKLLNVRKLFLNNNQITDLSGLIGLKRLFHLEAANNQIKDISGLRQIMSLSILVLKDNQISKIDDLMQLQIVCNTMCLE
ncbi:Conserved_hypothetical protein [Hexamita inflata]|uniref:Uncharacterized protein n=1 Tax=Hexamita inflata TaxID=28002 RepID=A0AA86TJN5_9EUKA|nr:Conserved hypothetical protein [Hexamita inflata]